MNKNLLLIIILLGMLLTSCSKINIFTLDQDKALGLQTKQQIESSPKDYPLLSPSQYASQYNYLYNLRNQILSSGNVEHKDDFGWEMKIIKDDKVQNAFCTPGGYIYVYTGLIKYLDNSSALAGVLGHEIAHADKRHSTQLLTQQYGLELLISIISGSAGDQIGQIAGSLSQLGVLQFSKDHENEADTYSVKYLCPTTFQSDGAALFFEKLIASGNTSNVPTFLSTHPSEPSRVANIKNQAATLGATCTSNKLSISNDIAYTQFKNSL
jgi:predicted Zn-dependent protease